MSIKKRRQDQATAPPSLRGIQETAETLKTLFAGKRVLEVTTADINRYLDGLKVELRRKFNVCSRMSQFFN